MSVQSFAYSVAQAVNKLKQQQSQTLRGQVVGDGVIAGGTTYSATVGIDTPLEDGDYVWVQTVNGSKAVVIGK